MATDKKVKAQLPSIEESKIEESDHDENLKGDQTMLMDQIPVL